MAAQRGTEVSRDGQNRAVCKLSPVRFGDLADEGCAISCGRDFISPPLIELPPGEPNSAPGGNVPRC